MTNMKHFLISVAMAGVLALCLQSCSKDDGPAGPSIPSMADRTVIVYMSGENNLSSFFQADLGEMVTGMKSVSSNTNLVAYIDHSNSTHKPYIVRISNDARQPVDTLYTFTDDFISSDPRVMSEVLQRIITMCPANDYGLVLWGHGSGWVIESDTIATTVTKQGHRAYGVDNGNNSSAQSDLSKWMNIPTLARTLQQLGTPWKFIFCDCCNMMNAEVAYELQRCASYLIAPPSETPGMGAPYTTITKDLFIKDDATMCQAICNDFHAQVDRVNGHLPIAAVRLSAMPSLASATAAVLPAVNDWVTANPQMKDVTYYYAYLDQDNEKVMYDMQDVISRALADDATAYQNWLNAYQQAIVYQLGSNLWHANYVSYADMPTFDVSRQGSMSMFFPMQKYEDSVVKYRYNDLIRHMAWYYAVGWPNLGW